MGAPTDSTCCRTRCPAASRTSARWSFRSCSAAALCEGNMRGRRCASISGFPTRSAGRHSTGSGDGMSELFAVLCACCSAVSSIFISELKGRLPLLQLIKWQIIAAFAMNCLFATMLGKWSVLEPWQFGLLAGSGISGVVIAGTAYISTIHATGPRITALLFSLTAPFSLGLGYLFLGETASLLQ